MNPRPSSPPTTPLSGMSDRSSDLDRGPPRARDAEPVRAPLLALALALALTPAAACQGGTPSSTETGTGTDSQGSGSSSTGTPAEPMQLVRADAWVAVEKIADPLADHRPEPVDCSLGGLLVEGEELDIDTNLCNYAMLEQPGLAEIPEGATLTLAMRHFDLTAPEPATAHVALLLGDVIAWERTLIIPGPAEVITTDFPAPMAYAKGEPVRFHLHNHGQNTWILTGVTVTP